MAPKPLDIINAISAPTGALAGAGLGMATTNWSNNKQYHQQKRLQNLQVRGQKEMADYNQALAMDIWERTNYQAQIKQMEKAGLNVGLMYGGQGAGGTTSGGQGGGVSGATAGIPDPTRFAGMGMQAGLQSAMMHAQIENIKAQTNKLNTDAGLTAGPTTDKTLAEIKKILEDTKNTVLQGAILATEGKIKDILLNREGRTNEDIIKAVSEELRKLGGEADSAQAKGLVDKNTTEQVKEGIQLANDAVKQDIASSKVGVKATEAGIKATEASTDQTRQNIKNLQATEEGQILLNAMRMNGVEPTDSPALRLASKWLQTNDISMKSFSKKLKSIVLWLKGENGEQTMERFKEIMAN